MLRFEDGLVFLELALDACDHFGDSLIVWCSNDQNTISAGLVMSSVQLRGTF